MLIGLNESINLINVINAKGKEKELCTLEQLRE